jgi:hypothetical protein
VTVEVEGTKGVLSYASLNGKTSWPTAIGIRVTRDTVANKFQCSFNGAVYRSTYASTWVNSTTLSVLSTAVDAFVDGYVCTAGTKQHILLG